MASRLLVLWRGLRRIAGRWRVQLSLGLRVTLAAVLALVAAQYFQLRLPLWTVLTALIVTQMSVGRSLKATGDYLVGTLLGAIYGAVIGILIPHTGEATLLLALVAAVAPMALLAAFRSSMNVLPITAIIVLLVPEMIHTTPLESAVERVLEVALGAVIGLVVSFVVLPSSAHRLMRQLAARLLDLMAGAMTALLAGLQRGLDDDELHRLQDGIGQGLAELNEIGEEAERERRARLSSGPETGPLRRTLLRLRHDLVMVGRAAGMPLPPEMRTRLAPCLDAIAAALSTYLRASGAALQARQGPATLAEFECALETYDAEVDAVRRDGYTRVLSGDAAERFFAVGFALEQMHQNLLDLERVVREWSAPAEDAQ